MNANDNMFKASFFVLVISLLYACAPSNTLPPAQTQTVPPINSPTFTLAPTQKPTSTLAPAPSENIITNVEPDDPYSYPISGTPSMPINKEQFKKVFENVGNSDSVSTCPKIWIMAIPDEPNPFYALFVNASQDDEEKEFATAIYATNPEAEPYIVGVGVIPPDVGGKFATGIEYRPLEGQVQSGEFEIQVNFPGCEIYKEIVTWP